MNTYDWNRLYLLLGQALFTGIQVYMVDYLPPVVLAVNAIFLQVNLAALSFVTEPKRKNEDSSATDVTSDNPPVG